MKKLLKTTSLMQTLINKLNFDLNDEILNQKELYQFLKLFHKSQLHDLLLMVKDNFYVSFDFDKNQIKISHDLYQNEKYSLGLHPFLKNSKVLNSFLISKSQIDFNLLLKEIANSYRDEINKLYKSMCMPKSNYQDFVDTKIQIVDLNPEGIEEFITDINSSVSVFGVSHLSLSSVSKQISDDDIDYLLQIIKPLFLDSSEYSTGSKLIKELVRLKNDQLLIFFLKQENIISNTKIIISFLEKLSALHDKEISISDSTKETILSIFKNHKYEIKDIKDILNLSYSNNKFTQDLIDSFYNKANIEYKNNIKYFLFKPIRPIYKDKFMISKNFNYYYTNFLLANNFVFSNNIQENYRFLFSDNKKEVDLFFKNLESHFENIFMMPETWYFYSKYYALKFNLPLKINNLHVISEKTDSKVYELIHDSDFSYEYLATINAQTVKE